MNIMDTLMGLCIGFGLLALLSMIILITLLLIEHCVMSWRRIFSLTPPSKNLGTIKFKDVPRET